MRSLIPPLRGSHTKYQGVTPENTFGVEESPLSPNHNFELGLNLEGAHKTPGEEAGYEKINTYISVSVAPHLIINKVPK